MDPESLSPLVLVGIGVIGLSMYLWVFKHVRSESNFLEQRLREWSKRMGLDVQTHRRGSLDGSSLRASGKLLGQELRVEAGSRGQGTATRYAHLWSHVNPPGGFPVPMRVAPEGFAATLWKTVSRADITVGDDAFDAQVLLAGEDEPGIVGLLDSETRSLMLDLVGAQGWTIDEAGLHSDPNLLTASEFEQFVESVSKAARLSGLLAREGTTEGRLIENLFAESKETVRSKIFDMLLLLPQTQAVRSALLQVPSLRSWEKTIRAAEALGEGGVRMLAEAAVSAPSPFASRAVRALGALSGAAGANAIRAALKRPEDDVVVAAAEALGELQDSASADALSDILSGTRGPAVRAAAATALGRTCTLGTRPSLLRALADHEPEVRRAAIAALAGCGTVDDIPDLIGVEYGTDRDLRSEARQAIAAIQKRVGHADQGMLSLAEQTATEGALSVESSAAEGSLSIVLDRDHHRPDKTQERTDQNRQ